MSSISRQMLNPNTDSDVFQAFRKNFCRASSYQGRIAYCFMSVHAVNPFLLIRILRMDPYNFLYYNMLYGFTMILICRPAMKSLNYTNRITFGLLGSYMFNRTVMAYYNWLLDKIPNRPLALTLLGFLGGRFMIVYFLAYLYHVDTRMDPGLDRYSRFEIMYNHPTP